MRLNVYTTDFTGEFELVTNETSPAVVDEGDEFLDGVRMILASPDGNGPENAVTVWVPADKYEATAEMFDGMASAVRGLAKQRSRS